MKTDTFDVEVDYVRKLLGINLSNEEIFNAAKKMGVLPQHKNAQVMSFEVNATRPDILHACDIAEEIGIGYGFNNIPMVYPPTNTVGSFIPENKFTDLLRHELA